MTFYDHGHLWPQVPRYDITDCCYKLVRDPVDLANVVGKEREGEGPDPRDDARKHTKVPQGT